MDCVGIPEQTARNWGAHMATMVSIAVAGLFLGGLGSALATVLAMANRKLYVFADPRIDELEQMLPRTNCGACGTPGCRVFAEQLVANRIVPAECTVSIGIGWPCGRAPRRRSP